MNRIQSISYLAGIGILGVDNRGRVYKAFFMKPHGADTVGVNELLYSALSDVLLKASKSPLDREVAQYTPSYPLDHAYFTWSHSGEFLSLVWEDLRSHLSKSQEDKAGEQASFLLSVMEEADSQFEIPENPYEEGLLKWHYLCVKTYPGLSPSSEEAINRTILG